MQILLNSTIGTSIKRMCPLFITPVSAGFPSPADDYVEQGLDLNEFLIEHPSATFFVRAEGDSMVGAGINNGDILVVDRSLEARDGSVIIAVFNGEFTVKRLRKGAGRVYLVPDNPKFKVIEVTADADFQIWGVATTVIHSLK